MALPDKHQLKFNSYKDDKTLMEAIDKRNKTDLEEQSLDDLFNSLKIYEAEVKHSSSTGTTIQNLAFVSSSNINSATESDSAAASVSAVCSKMHVSFLPNIDSDDLEEMDLKWQMAMKGHFARECKSPKDSRKNGVVEPHRRNVSLSPTKPKPDLSLTNRHSTPIIEDWVSDSEDESKTKAPKIVPSFVQSTTQVKSPRPSVQHVDTYIRAATPKPANYDYHEKNPNFQKQMVPTAVLAQSKPVSIAAVRPVGAAVPKFKVTRPRHATPIVTKTNLPIRRHITRSPSPKANNSPPRVTSVKALVVNAAKGKFEGKVDEGFLVRYSVTSKAFKVFNSRTRIVQETLHANFLENTPNVAGSGPTWLFNIDSLTKIMNYQPITAGNQSNPSAGFQDKFDAEKVGEEIDQQYVLFPMWSFGSINPQNTDGDATFDGKEHELDEKKPESEVNVSPSSSAQSRKQDDKTKKEAKGKSPVESLTRYKDLNVEFEDYFNNNINEVNTAEELASPDQMISGKDSSNPLMAGNLPKIIWYSTHHIPLIKSWLVQKQTALGVNTPRCDEDRLKLMELTVFLLPKVEKVEIGVSAVDLQVSAVMHMLLLLLYKLLLFSLTNWCCSLSAVRKQVGNLSTHTTKYTSPALTQKVFANMRRVGKGFCGVETPLFEGMLVAQEVVVEGDDEVHGKQVNAGDVAEGDISAAYEEVPTAAEEPSIPSPTPPTLPPQPSHVIPSTSQLKRRVKKLERRNKVKVLKLRRLQKVGTSQRVETSAETVMDDEDDREVANAVKDVQDAKVDESVDIQGRQAESQAEIYKIDLDHANKVLSMQEDKTEPAEVQEVVEVVTTAKAKHRTQVPSVTLTAAPARVTATPSRRRKGVVIRDLQEESTTSTIIPAETKSKDKGKGILVKEPKPLKKKQHIKQDEKYAKELQAELNKNIDWDKAIDHNVAGFKMDYFKGMSYDDIRPIFEAKFNTNLAFLLKTKDQIEEDENEALKRLNETPTEKAAKRKKLDEKVEELKRHLQIVPNEDDDVYTEATPLARKVLVVDYQIIKLNNKPYYKIIRADDTHQLYVSFLSLLRNFDREDLEALWILVKEIFSTTKPKNFSDDFLLVTLGAMFEKPDIHAHI
uniref:Retroviral polymerase SH3-like domain-containing protein n=1 Tax=Tanacetum cinerariifolium TaxID=118510 RepID=A0A6L2L661_TANCI|nr:hypothetical protein [Tanacetum cinerariifolium]